MAFTLNFRIPRTQNAEFFEFGNDDLCCLFGSLIRCVDRDLGVFRCFIRAVDPGEVGDLAFAGLFIKAFHVALFADFNRGVDKDLDELAIFEKVARKLAFAFERRYEGYQRDDPGIDKQLGGFTHTADVFHPVGIGKAKVLVQSVTDIVTIKGVGVLAHGMQLFLDQVGDGRFTGTRKTREPQNG